MEGGGVIKFQMLKQVSLENISRCGVQLCILVSRRTQFLPNKCAVRVQQPSPHFPTSSHMGMQSMQFHLLNRRKKMQMQLKSSKAFYPPLQNQLWKNPSLVTIFPSIHISARIQFAIIPWFLRILTASKLYLETRCSLGGNGVHAC